MFLFLLHPCNRILLRKNLGLSFFYSFTFFPFQIVLCFLKITSSYVRVVAFHCTTKTMEKKNKFIKNGGNNNKEWKGEEEEIERNICSSTVSPDNFLPSSLLARKVRYKIIMTIAYEKLKQLFLF